MQGGEEEKVRVNLPVHQGDVHKQFLPLLTGLMLLDPLVLLNPVAHGLLVHVGGVAVVVDREEELAVRHLGLRLGVGGEMLVRADDNLFLLHLALFPALDLLLDHLHLHLHLLQCEPLQLPGGILYEHYVARVTEGVDQLPPEAHLLVLDGEAEGLGLLGQLHALHLKEVHVDDALAHNRGAGLNLLVLLIDDLVRQEDVHKQFLPLLLGDHLLNGLLLLDPPALHDPDLPELSPGLQHALVPHVHLVPHPN